MSGVWLFCRLRSLPLVTVLTVATVAGFALLGDRHVLWGTMPQQVDVPLVSMEPVVLALLFFLTLFSVMAPVDDLGGSRMLRRRVILHGATLLVTVALVLVAAVALPGSGNQMLLLRNYGVYVAMAVAAGLVLDELGFAAVVAYWVFCTLFGRTPQAGAQWWAVPYRGADPAAWAVTIGWVVTVLTASLATHHLNRRQQG